MNVLVTGGTGYVGLNLVHGLLTQDHEVAVLARESSPTHLLPEAVDTVHGDLTRPETLSAALQGVDAVAHLAAVRGANDTSGEGRGRIDYDLAERINVDGTEQLLRAAERSAVETVVHTSTIYAHPDIPLPGGETDGASIYVETKAASDGLFVENEWPFDYAITYPTYILGPRDYRMKRFEPFQVAASNRVIVPPLYMPGHANIVHVDDVVDSLIHLLRSPTNDRAVISGRNVTSRRYLSEIARACPGRRIVLPFPLYERVIPPIGNALHSIGALPVSGTRLAELTRTLGVVPERYTERGPVQQRSLQAAVRDTYVWYESVGLL